MLILSVQSPDGRGPVYFVDPSSVGMFPQMAGFYPGFHLGQQAYMAAGGVPHHQSPLLVSSGMTDGFQHMPRSSLVRFRPLLSYRVHFNSDDDGLSRSPNGDSDGRQYVSLPPKWLPVTPLLVYRPPSGQASMSDGRLFSGSPVILPGQQLPPDSRHTLL